MSNGQLIGGLIEIFKQSREVLVPFLLIVLLFGLSVFGGIRLGQEVGVIPDIRATEHRGIMNYLEQLAETYKRGLLVEAADCWNRAVDEGGRKNCRDAYKGRALPMFEGNNH